MVSVLVCYLSSAPWCFISYWKNINPQKLHIFVFQCVNLCFKPIATFRGDGEQAVSLEILYITNKKLPTVDQMYPNFFGYGVRKQGLLNMLLTLMEYNGSRTLYSKKWHIFGNIPWGSDGPK